MCQFSTWLIKKTQFKILVNCANVAAGKGMSQIYIYFKRVDFCLPLPLSPPQLLDNEGSAFTANEIKISDCLLYTLIAIKKGIGGRKTESEC